MAPKRRVSPRSARLASLGKVVEEARLATKISQQELALRSGTHLNYVSKLEAGQRNPTFEVLSEISAGLDLSLSTLIRRVERDLKTRN